MGRPAVERHRSGCKCCGGKKLFQIPMHLRYLPLKPLPPKPEYIQLRMVLKDFPIYASMKNMMRPGKRLSPCAQQILNIVAAFPNITRKQIVYKSGYKLHFATVSSYITYMVHEGILVANTFSKAHRYTLAPKLRIRKVEHSVQA